MLKKNPLVSIVIPTHNRKRSAERLIKSILNSTYKKIEVIVVDDTSSDGTYNFLKKRFSNNKIKIIKNKKNLFTAGSRNIGLKKSKGDLIFFIDDDNVLDRNAISSLVKVFINDPKVGEAGPVNYNFNNKNKVLWFITKRNMLTTKTYQPRDIRLMERKTTWETADVPNAFMVNSGLLKKNKVFFREEFGIMYEESDIAYRIRNLGYKIVVVKNAKIYHDIEKKEKDRVVKDYMFHFMDDKRRPYVFARNRIIFHSLYSTKLQFIFIILFWIWFFAAYYIYKIIFYKGAGNFSILNRISLSYSYLEGTFNGLFFVFSKKKLY